MEEMDARAFRARLVPPRCRSGSKLSEVRFFYNFTVSFYRQRRACVRTKELFLLFFLSPAPTRVFDRSRISLSLSRNLSTKPRR